MANRAVFLDRDGTLIEEVGYATRPEQIRILGGVARALARLAGAGYKLVVVTNQSGIARGLLTEDDLNRFHQALDDHLGLLGARVDVYYTCPHHPDPAEAVRPELAVDCQCRKPRPGLILQAARDLGLDLAESWLVGDTWRDIEAGQAAGVQTIKLPAIPSHDGPRPPQVQPPTAEAASLERAADMILQSSTSSLQPPASSLQNYRSAAQEPAESPAPPHVESAAAAPVAPPPVAPLEPAPPERLLEPPRPGRAEVAWPQSQAEAIALEEVTREPEAEAIEVGVEPESAAAPAPPHAVETTAPVEVAEVPAPAAAAPPEAAPAPTCARCGQVVAVADLVSGAAGRRGGFLLCAACLPHHPPDTADAIPNSATGLLRESLLELRRIGRRERTSGLSLLRLLAYLAQAAALFSGLVMALVSTDRVIYLQAAVFLQLLVLTLLLLERRS
jgi:D-glycero-D-manno-heptose 1,7-bisphosphate phosphatase